MSAEKLAGNEPVTSAQASGSKSPDYQKDAINATDWTAPGYRLLANTQSAGNREKVLYVGRLLRRALLLFGIYAAVIAAVIVAGFLGETLGIWASILWGAGVLAGIAIYGRRRLART